MPGEWSEKVRGHIIILRADRSPIRTRVRNRAPDSGIATEFPPQIDQYQRYTSSRPDGPATGGHAEGVLSRHFEFPQYRQISGATLLDG
jgi:hypothetical protein